MGSILGPPDYWKLPNELKHMGNVGPWSSSPLILFYGRFCLIGAPFSQYSSSGYMGINSTLTGCKYHYRCTTHIRPQSRDIGTPSRPRYIPSSCSRDDLYDFGTSDLIGARHQNPPDAEDFLALHQKMLGLN